MGDLTRNLSRCEFTCKCGCGFDTVDVELVVDIQSAADYFVQFLDADYAVVTITSGNRCIAHNASLDPPGAEDSQHIRARAADHFIEVSTLGIRTLVAACELAKFYESKHSGGVGRYPSGRVHRDTRTNGPAYWDNS